MVKVLDAAAVDAAIERRGLRWEHRGGTLVRQWRGADFADALAYVVRVGALAEAAGHHPDIDIRWSTVRLALVTHSAGAVTERDVELAAAIDALDEDLPEGAARRSAGAIDGAPAGGADDAGGDLRSGAGGGARGGAGTSVVLDDAEQRAGSDARRS